MEYEKLERRLEHAQISDEEIVVKQRDKFGEEHVIFYLPKSWKPKVYGTLEVSAE
ncbi:MAG: hypothetical protein KKB79_00495 [Nanoarchaeota archaeon]|nr:hypothetical protein [Nanoarchaeota archaeon]